MAGVHVIAKDAATAGDDRLDLWPYPEGIFINVHGLDGNFYPNRLLK